MEITSIGEPKNWDLKLIIKNFVDGSDKNIILNLYIFLLVLSQKEANFMNICRNQDLF